MHDQGALVFISAVDMGLRRVLEQACIDLGRGYHDFGWGNLLRVQAWECLQAFWVKGTIGAIDCAFAT